MKQKAPIPLNIPKDKNLRFDEVSFVNDMSEVSLKVFIKRIWAQLMALANAFDTKRSDVPLIVDKIMSGKRWTKNDVYDRFSYGIHSQFIIQYDTLKKEFKLLNSDDRSPITNAIPAITVSEAKKYSKDLNNTQAESHWGSHD